MITIRTRISYLLILLLAAVVHHYNTVEKIIYIYIYTRTFVLPITC